MTDDVHEFLTAPKKIRARIVCIDERIADLKTMIQPSGIRYDVTKVQTSPKDAMLEYAASLNSLEQERAALLKKYQIAQDKIAEAIQKVQDCYAAQVLTMRYIGGKKFEKIIDEMPFEAASVYRFHKKGLKNLESIIKRDSE